MGAAKTSMQGGSVPVTLVQLGTEQCLSEKEWRLRNLREQVVTNAPFSRACIPDNTVGGMIVSLVPRFSPCTIIRHLTH